MLTSLFPNTHSRYTSLPVLGALLDELCAWLDHRGYPRDAICRRVEAAPLLDRCFREQQIGSLAGHTAIRLRACFPRQKRWTPQIACALGRSLLSYLEERSSLASVPATLSEQLVQTYSEYLQRVRGLAPSTVARHVIIAASFLRHLRYEDDPQQLAHIPLISIETFVAEASSHVGQVTVQKVITITRSFLRFLGASGKTRTGLDRCLESPRHYRDNRLVRALAWDDILRLLRTIDSSTVKGCRDYAMLLLIATYGLRRSEVAALAIHDVQWRARVIRVPRPKIGTPLAMPLTDEVATALISYLRCRQDADSSEQKLFLRVRAPRGPIEATAVGDAFDYWAERAGIHVPGHGGPHCLRHGIAMHLLRNGTPLKTIGDILGHRTVESTSVYLRLQVEDLRSVALPLPSNVPVVEVRS